MFNQNEFNFQIQNFHFFAKIKQLSVNSLIMIILMFAGIVLALFVKQLIFFEQNLGKLIAKTRQTRLFWHTFKRFVTLLKTSIWLKMISLITNLVLIVTKIHTVWQKLSFFGRTSLEKFNFLRFFNSKIVSCNNLN